MRRIALLAIASIVLLLTACATTTETHSTWQTKTGESHPTFRHMYVLVLADDPMTPSAPLAFTAASTWARYASRSLSRSPRVSLASVASTAR